MKGNGRFTRSITLQLHDTMLIGLYRPKRSMVTPGSAYVNIVFKSDMLVTSVLWDCGPSSEHLLRISRSPSVIAFIFANLHYQCNCGTSPINIRTAACPRCGKTRCAYCSTTRVQVRRTFPIPLDEDNDNEYPPRISDEPFYTTS